MCSAARLQCHVKDSFKTQGDERLVMPGYPPAFPDAGISLEEPAIALNEGTQVGAAYFLLAFDEKLHGDGQLSARLQKGFEGEEASDYIALVVGDASSAQVSLNHHRFKWWCRP